ncbi:hypothetical protein FACS1894110_13680 [Spirochaetia bacterium]|nr:hypothetical protein FACS1894110_13680 [Spirochaetia bacterium]
MFCSGCGKEIPEGSKFCPGCGKAADGTPNVTNVASDPTKILKEGEFRRVEKIMDAMSKKNDGKLTLFCDRVEWSGRVSENIKIDDIVKVVVGGNSGGDPSLDITDSAGKTLKYFHPRSVLEALGGANNGVGAQLRTTIFANSQADIDSWRAAIEKLRGRL